MQMLALLGLQCWPVVVAWHSLYGFQTVVEGWTAQVPDRRGGLDHPAPRPPFWLAAVPSPAASSQRLLRLRCGGAAQEEHDSIKAKAKGT